MAVSEGWQNWGGACVGRCERFRQIVYGSRNTTPEGRQGGREQLSLTNQLTWDVGIQRVAGTRRILFDDRSVAMAGVAFTGSAPPEYARVP